MENLIEALQIFLKYSKDKYPTNCSHDKLYVNVDPDLVSAEDKIRLEELGFTPDEESGGGFQSFRFGSC